MGLFKRNAKPELRVTGLRLAHPPSPEFAPAHAQAAVEAARNVDGIVLDYSPGSLASVDETLLSLHREALRADQIGETVFSFGCYAGEVFVRGASARWALPADCLPPDLAAGADLMLVQLPSGAVWNPIGKAFKRLEDGEPESLAYLYEVATSGET